VRQSAVLRIVLLALFWGSSFLWIKLAIRGLSPAEVTLGRLVLGAGVLFAIVAARRQPVPRSPALWGQIVIAALFGNAAPYLLFALSEQHVASSTAGMLNATTPLWTVLVALAVRHQRSVSPAQAAGLAVGFAGSVLIFTPWRSASGFASVGAIESLAAAASYGIAYVYMDRYLARRGLGSVLLAACQLLAAALVLAVVVGVTGAPAPRLDATVTASIVVLGLLGTGAAYVLNYQIITSEGATVASTVTYLLPVVAIVLGVTVLGEQVTLPVMAGIALVLAGVALTRTPPARAGRPRRPR
jgi:drug/metabolite transporter (DMT)-like permease